jgi:hypothetical protein
MRKLRIAAAIAASPFALVALSQAPAAQATTQGDQCYNWHATMQDANGRTLYCTHLPQSAPGGGSGHLMYWELSIQDSAYRTTPSGFKTDDGWYGFGSGHPCNSNDVKVIKVTQNGNAIERWGPKGCDPVLPMTGTN